LVNGGPPRIIHHEQAEGPVALRSAWKGVIRFSLVSVPVEAYTAAESGHGEIHFNQLHDKCHSRIRYKKTCPIHGEVSNDEIVSGYEYEKDKYVILDKDELDSSRKKGDRSITIDTFVEPDTIDPIYYDGRTYYLTPDSAGSEKPYALLCQAMAKMGRYGVANIVLHNKEELALVRPLDGVLTMTMLSYESQVRSPATVKEEIPEVKANTQEMKLAQQLIDASTADKFDFSQYTDTHTDKLRELIDAKVAGKEIVAPPEVEEDARVINLMDALKKSVQQQKKKAPVSAKAKQARKMLASQLSRSGEGTAPRRRKKSS
jgi:DNA end-binding protein Ku